MTDLFTVRSKKCSRVLNIPPENLSSTHNGIQPAEALHMIKHSAGQRPQHRSDDYEMYDMSSPRPRGSPPSRGSPRQSYHQAKAYHGALGNHNMSYRPEM